MTETGHYKAGAAARALPHAMPGTGILGASILNDIAREYRVLRDRAAWALVGAIGYFLIASTTIAFNANGSGYSSIWPADAVILALMLSRPRRDWSVLLLAGWAANLLANGVGRGWTGGIVFYGAVHVGQMLMAAWIMNRSLLGDDLLTDGRTTARFLIGAGLLAPALGAVGGALVSVLTYGSAFGPSFLSWYGGTALGAVIFTPFFKALFDGRFVREIEAQTLAGQRRGLVLFGLHALMTMAVFSQATLPILFLPFSTLLMLSFGQGRLATLGGIVLIAVIGASASEHMAGPMALIHQAPVLQSLFFQFYLAVMMCTALPVAAIVASRAEARTLLAEREELLRLVMAHSPDAILAFDGAGICRWADGPVRDYLGLAPENLVGVPLATLAARAGVDLDQISGGENPDGDHAAVAALRTAEFRSPSQPQITLEATLRSAHHLRDGHTTHAVGSVITLRDITLRKARELAISRRIEIDDLTGVFSRAGFRQRFTRAIEAAVLPGRAVTLALIDVDHFKSINDTHGHSAGDAALVEIARRLLAGTRQDDVVGRMSGDEFAILFRCDLDSAQAICERITRVVATEPIVVIGNVRVLTSISCGLAQLRPGMTREALFDSADLALYEAKRSGRNGVRAMFAG
jgi:diguanylate cyclase (GGDEF)-like protein